MTLAELIIKIGLSGVDKVKSGLAAIRGEVKTVGEAATSAGQKIEHGLEGPLKAMAETAKRTTLAIAGITSATAVLVGTEGVKASLAFTELSARLEAVTGSADKAARKLAYAQSVANPSNFTFKQLADATVTLEAFGINAERALPTVARLGMAFGAGNDQLMELVRGLGDLSQGKFPEIEVLSAFGLNRSQFTEKGIKFDGQGQLLSSATQAMTALEKIVNEKYGNIFAKMADTPGAKLASLQDGWEKFTRIIGDGVLRVAAPAIENLTTLINAMGSSGVMKEVIGKLADGFSQLFSGLNGDGLTRFAANVLAVLGNLPSAFATARDEVMGFRDVVFSNFKAVGDYIGNLFTALSNNVGVFASYAYKKFAEIANAISAVFSFQITMIQAYLTNLIKSFGLMGTIIGAMVKGVMNNLTTLGTIVGKKVGTDIRGDKTLPQFMQMPTLPKLQSFAPMKNIDLLKGSDDIYARLMAASKATDNKVPDAVGNFLNKAPTETAKETEKLTRQIAQNTGKTVDALSLRRQSLGGGTLASIGATPAELAGGGYGGMGSGNRSSGGVGNQSFGSVGNDIAQAIDRAADAKVRSILARQTGNGRYPR